MRLLKQRLKRVVVCLLALPLLLQPITAYAGYTFDGVKDEALYCGTLKGLQIGQVLRSGSLLLADFYDKANDQSIMMNKTVDALFYTKVPEHNDYMSIVYSSEKLDDQHPYAGTPMLFKLWSNYKDESVYGWKIISIEEVLEEYDSRKDETPVIHQYTISRDWGESSDVASYGSNFTYDYSYIATIWHLLIEVEPVFDELQNPVTVTFDPNGGTCGVSSKQVCKSESYGELPEAVRDKHTFLGWYTDRNNGTEITEDSIKQDEEDETLYAHWEEYQYTIHFNPNFEPGGGIMPDMTLKYSEEKSLTQNEFTREGYTFLGWNTDKDATSVLYQDQQAVRSLSEENNDEVTLYAIWQSLPTVTFDPNGGSACNPSSKQVDKDARYGDLPETVRDKHTFLGWYTDKDNGTEITEDSIKQDDKDETLYAHWEEYQYTIKFNANGGAGTMADMTLKYSDKTALTENTFTRQDYQFLGWNTDKNATSVEYRDGEKVQSLTDKNNGEVTLYAVWQASLTPATVTFDPNGGTCNEKTRQMYKGGRYSPLPEASWDKHTFLGWYTDKDDGTKITEDSIKQDDKDETLYAHWEEYQYTIKFDANGGAGSMADMTLKYSDKAALTKNAFTKSGYQFKGWNTDKDAVLVKYKDEAEIQSLTGENNGVVTLYAVWQKPTKETPPKNPPEKDTPKKTPASPSGGNDAPRQSEIVKTYVVQKIENVKTSDSIYIYRYIIMFVIGAGFIFLSYRFKKKQ